MVHPAAGNWSGTLLNGLLARYPQSAALPRAGIVHRLDKDTSGLMVVGKTLAAVTALVRAIAGARGAPPLPGDRARQGAGGAVQRRGADRPRSADARCAWRSSPRASRPGPTSSGIADRRRPAARCAAPCTPGARTRSACTWRRAACRWSATASTAAGRRSGIERQALHAAELAFAHPLVGPAARLRLAPCRATWRRRWRQLDRFSRLDAGPAGIAYNHGHSFRCDRPGAPRSCRRPTDRRDPSRPDRTRVCISTTGQRLRTGPAAFQT